MADAVSQDEIVTEALIELREQLWLAAKIDGTFTPREYQVDAIDAAITAMRAANQERGDDDAVERFVALSHEQDAKWLRTVVIDRCSLDNVERKRAHRIADRLQPKAPETGEG